MNQNYDSQQLLKLCKSFEWESYGMTKEHLISKIDKNNQDIIKGDFTFDVKKVGDYYMTDDLSQKLIIRKLNDNIHRLYKDSQANRRLIIKQVSTLLSENGDMWVFRTDIRKFFESIERDKLFSKIRNDAMLSFSSQIVLKKLFSTDTLTNSKGLPRGLNISSTLSELYMRGFDKWIRRYEGVYFYARFVDDIIVFCNNKKCLNKLKQEIDANLGDGLMKNISKTGIYDGNNILSTKPLEYLGYKFITSLEGSKKTLIISIADKKVQKLKTRVILSLIDYTRNTDFRLLEDRLRFLTGNFSVKKSPQGNHLKAGIYYNYSSVTDTSIFDELNLFLRRAVYSKNGKFGKKLSQKLDNHQRQLLVKYSFKYGYIKKVYHSFNADQLKRIKRYWV